VTKGYPDVWVPCICAGFQTSSRTRRRQKTTSSWPLRSLPLSLPLSVWVLVVAVSGDVGRLACHLRSGVVLPTIYQAPTPPTHMSKSCLPLHVLLEHTQSNRGTHANPCQLIAQSNWRVCACACVCGNACVCRVCECRAHICAARLAHSNGLHGMCYMQCVAWQLLKNANVAAGMVLPSCQDTGTVSTLSSTPVSHVPPSVMYPTCHLPVSHLPRLPIHACLSSTPSRVSNFSLSQ